MHRSLLTASVIGLSLALGLGGCASSGETKPPTTDAELHRSGQVILAGQISPDQIRGLHADGVRTVISCRRQSEMDALPFDEPAMLNDHGVTYTHLPLGGDDGYTPDDVDAFAAALQSTGGNVLLHCASGGRARLLYAAYLIRYEGRTVDEAMQRTQAMGGGPSSLERLLGERIRYELTGEPLPPDDES